MCQPQAPNPSTVINQQTAANKDTAISQQNLNLINQTDAQGNKLTYDQIGTWADGTPKYGATQSLSDAGQQLLSTNQGTQQNLADLGKEQSGRLGTLLNAPLDFSSLPAAGKLPTTDYAANVQQVQDALLSRLQPQLDQSAEKFQQSLINRGIRPGSTAYQQEMETFNQGVNDQRTSVVLNAGQEQNRLQSLDLNAANFANTTRSNALNEQLTQRETPLNELLAVAGQGQVQQPSFANTPSTGVAGVNTAGIQQQSYDNAQGQYATNQSILGGLFSAGGKLLSLSDRRAKTNIEHTGEEVAGVPVAEWDWKNGGGHSRGVIAQELAKVHPDLVDKSGSMMKVNYPGLLARAGASL